jgi:uncharacterized membrane protein
MSAGLSAPRESRVDMLDAVRLLAAFQMIQGHTIDALLSDSLRNGAFFHAWTWIRGLTAPIFLIAAGVSFSLAASLSEEPKFFARRTGRARRRRMLRSLALIVTGTLMHIGDDPLRIDVLQCVGLSLLMLDLFVGITPGTRSVFSFALLCAVLFSYDLPPMAVSEDDVWMRIPLAFVGHETGSLFPLFPWAAYVFGGVAVAQVILPEGAKTNAVRIAWRCLSSALVAFPLSELASRVFDETAQDYSNRLSVILLRACCVVALMGACAFVFSRVTFPARVRWLAGETLALYVFHLLFLFAAVVGPVHLIGPTLSWPSVTMAALAMLVLSVLVARFWMWLWPRIEVRVFPPEPTPAVR